MPSSCPPSPPPSVPPVVPPPPPPVAPAVLLPSVVGAVPVWLPAAVWFPVVAPVALAAVALAAVALVPVIFCCAMAVSPPMTHNNPNRSAAATNIPAIGIADAALAVLLLLILSDPLCRFINASEGLWNLTISAYVNKQ